MAAGIAVVAALIVGIVIGALVYWARARRASTSREVAKTVTDVDATTVTRTGPRGAPKADAVVEVDTVLVPVGDLEFPDVFLALGPSGELESLAANGAWSTAGTSVAAANMVAQAIQGYTEAATLVRLSPDTVNLMKSGAEVIKAPGGFNFGVLRDAGSGRFVGQVKWAKAGSAVSTAAALGNALTMAMIQMQLNAISDQLTALTRTVDRMSASLGYATDSELRASVKAISDVRQQAEISGMVTDRQLRAVQGESRNLDAHIRRLEMECSASLRRLNSVNSQKARLDWLREDGLPVAKALNELTMASRAWVTSRALEAANMVTPENNHQSVRSANRTAAEVLLQQTRERMRELDRLVGELGYQFGRAIDLVEMTTGKVTLQERVAGKVVPVELEKDRVSELAAALRAQLDAIGIDIASAPAMRPVQEVGETRGDDDETWRRVIPLLLNPDETVQVILHGLGVGGHHNLSTTSSAIVVTDQRILALRKRDLAREGALQLNEPITRIRHVKYKTAYGFDQLRVTLSEGPLGMVGGIAVDLGMTPDEVKTAIAILEPILAGQTEFAPQGPNFDEALRRLDGGPRWTGDVAEEPPEAIEAGRSVPLKEPWEDVPEPSVQTESKVPGQERER